MHRSLLKIIQLEWKINKFLDNYKSIIKENDHVVFISDKGDISAILANGFVENLGMKNIYSLKGGIEEWVFKGNKLTN